VPTVVLMASLIVSSILVDESANAHVCLTWENTWRRGTTVIVVCCVGGD